MPISRYDERLIITNASTDYIASPIFRGRGLSQVKQYATPELQYPSPDELKGITRNTRVWAIGTKYFNLANEFYGDPQYWWIIAWFNLRPLETDFRPGDVVVIPTPLETVLSGLGLM
jgi:hypothetical protein